MTESQSWEAFQCGLIIVSAFSPLRIESVSSNSSTNRRHFSRKLDSLLPSSTTFSQPTPLPTTTPSIILTDPHPNIITSWQAQRDLLKASTLSSRMPRRLSRAPKHLPPEQTKQLHLLPQTIHPLLDLRSLMKSPRKIKPTFVAIMVSVPSFP
jgi:hypothetical protein